MKIFFKLIFNIVKKLVFLHGNSILNFKFLFYCTVLILEMCRLYWYQQGENMATMILFWLIYYVIQDNTSNYILP